LCVGSFPATLCSTVLAAASCLVCDVRPRRLALLCSARVVIKNDNLVTCKRACMCWSIQHHHIENGGRPLQVIIASTDGGIARRRKPSAPPIGSWHASRRCERIDRTWSCLVLSRLVSVSFHVCMIGCMLVSLRVAVGALEGGSASAVPRVARASRDTTAYRLPRLRRDAARHRGTVQHRGAVPRCGAAVRCRGIAPQPGTTAYRLPRPRTREIVFLWTKMRSETRFPELSARRFRIQAPSPAMRNAKVSIFTRPPHPLPGDAYAPPRYAVPRRP
jgi:hypothetical protein